MILTDYALPQFDARRALEVLHEVGLDVPVLVVSGVMDEETGVECIQLGADDYLLKDRLERLGPAVDRAIADHRLRGAEQALLAANAELASRGNDLERANEELARSNQELEQFAYIASHDLQAPLRHVALFAQLLERQYADRLDDEARQYIGHAVGGVRRMQRLVADLLEFSRVGRADTAAEPVDLDAVLRAVLDDLAPAIAEAGARVTAGPLPTVMGNPTRLGQLLQNLIGNAVRYRGDAAPEIRVAATRQDATWRFSVSDNGIGIRPEHAERVFDIFRRLDPTRSDDGTGIGLAVCRRIVEHHGGRIWVESEQGRGADFIWTLPAGDGSG